MIRINLLPPEITQKRKDEQRWRYVVLGAILAAAVLALAFVIVQVQVSLKQNEVAAVKQQAAALAESAAKFQVFQQKEADLASRKVTAGQALQGRVDWSKLLSEVAMVLPTDAYLTRIAAQEPKPASGATAAQQGRLSLDGRALDYPNDAPDLGFKSVAKFLLRLAELDLLSGVWLSQSSLPNRTGTFNPLDSYVNFAVIANISAPPTSTTNTAPGVPAPPQN